VNAIEFHDVRLALGARLVLDHVDLSVPSGEFVGLLGPNGSGKTTLLRSILGLVPPAHGSIAVLGETATRGNANVGYVPQLHTALSVLRLTGWDVVATVVHGNRLGLPMITARDRYNIDKALEQVNARALARRPLAELSGGERQRLLLAQALIGGPRLLLMDEPLASLDPAHQDEVVALVKSLQQQLAITIVFSAHDLNPLLGAMDRVIYLGSGQAAIGTVDEVITGPVLSRLYGAEIDVVRVDGSLFVMSGRHHIEEHHAGPHPHHA
jgi:zinc/manganese transport system ATP-binding protein